MKKTLVIGASSNPERYSYKATISLLNHGHEVLLFGNKKDSVNGIEIQTEWNTNWKVDTVTLYVSPKNQTELIPKIIALNPNRVIFNPGTENEFFIQELEKKGIKAEIACTLVLLSIGNY